MTKVGYVVMRWISGMVLVVGMSFPHGATAQDDATLADIRQELTVLYVEVQRLKRELSTTGGTASNVGSGDTFDRIAAIESELQRLTGKSEELEFRIGRVIEDGTNRIGDLEFRLCELESGCDIGSLGDTPTLGGDAGAPVTGPAPTPQPETQLAANEQADFERAQEALTAREFRSAADQFATFNETYPGGPLAIEATLRRGEALEGLGDVREGARAYLAAFTMNQQGPMAAEALYLLGNALGRLGQSAEACVTLSEVGVRFPGAAAVADAEAAMRNLSCS